MFDAATINNLIYIKPLWLVLVLLLDPFEANVAACVT